MSAQQRSHLASTSSTETRARAFRVSEADLRPGCREVRVEGELDLSVAGELRQCLDAAAADEVDALVSLERCDFIDSTGLAAIIFARKRLASKGRRLLLCAPSSQVSRILTITGLNQAGLVYASAEEALASGDISIEDFSAV